MAAELEIADFPSADAFREWLRGHADASPGVRLRIAKKGASFTSITYAEAVDVALEFGWIDGQSNRLDEESYLQRFTPRRPQSIWSVRNRTIVEEKIAAGQMAPRGLAEVERARADGRWERAYEGSKDAQPHPDFLAALEKNPAAAASYEKLNAQNRFAIYFRIQNAKREETKARRIESIVEMLARGEKFYG